MERPRTSFRQYIGHVLFRRHALEVNHFTIDQLPYVVIVRPDVLSPLTLHRVTDQRLYPFVVCPYLHSPP